MYSQSSFPPEAQVSTNLSLRGPFCKQGTASFLSGSVWFICLYYEYLFVARVSHLFLHPKLLAVESCLWVIMEEVTMSTCKALCGRTCVFSWVCGLEWTCGVKW